MYYKLFIYILCIKSYAYNDIEEEIDWDKIETVDYQSNTKTVKKNQEQDEDEIMEQFLNNEFEQNNVKKQKQKEPQQADQQDIEALEQQLDMLQQFSCYMAVQKKLKDHKEDIKAMSKNLKAKTSFQKVVANLYSLCVENISPEKQKEVLQTNNPDDFAKLNFDFYQNYDINEVMSNPDSNMTESEAEFYQRYEKLEEQMAQLKQEAKDKIEGKKPNENTKEKNQQESNYFTGTDQLNILGFTFQKINPIFVFLPIICIILLIFKFMWNELFKTQQITRRKKDKKKKK